MPTWDPVVVCADDPESTAWVTRCLRDARRGICINVRQDGGKFNKLEALRAGIRIIAATIGASAGNAFTLESERETDGLPYSEHTTNDRVALFDADTVALRSTARTLECVPPGEIGVSSSGVNDDYGLLVAPLGTLWGAFRRIPIGYASGYGAEDMIIRVSCWLENKRPFRLIPPCWSRRQHSDQLRGMVYQRPATVTAREVKQKLDEFIRENVPVADFGQMRDEVFPMAGRFLRVPAKGSS